MNQKIILFVCGHNAGRSQMAEAYFNHINTHAKYKAVSCGTNPSSEINPVVRNILEHSEISQSIVTNLHPKLITEEMQKNAEKIFTMGCGVDCAVFSEGVEVVDLGIRDPHGEGELLVLQVFEEVKIRVKLIIEGLKDFL